MDRNEIPLGFGMALAQRPAAMERFAAMSEAQRQEIINGTHAIRSKAEMRKYVENILEK